MVNPTHTLSSPYLQLQATPDESTVVAHMPSGREHVLVVGVGVQTLWVGTQAQYDAIAVKDANTQYNTDAGIYVGETLVSGGGGVSIYVTGLAGTGLVDDLLPIQAALDEAGAAGGGVVYLPKGVFLCSNVVSIPSHVTLIGCGKEASVIRNPAGALPGKLIDSSWTYASIAMIGVKFAGVIGVGIDHSTNSSTCNGIQIGAIAGHTKDCFAKDCKVSGFDSHQYLIWNFRADNTVISGNTVIGNMAPASVADENGIEVYGGHNIQISSNTISSVGAGGAILVWEDDVQGSQTDVSDIRIFDNNITGGRRGISVSGYTKVENISIYGNQITGQTRSGIELNFATAAAVDSVTVNSNIISNVQQFGISINGNWGSGIKGVLFTGNIISDILDALGEGISIYAASGVLAQGNYVLNSAGYSAVLSGAVDSSLIGNVLSGATKDGVLAYNSCLRVTIADNKILGYGTVDGYGVRAGINDHIQILNNFFRYGSAAEVYAIYSSSTNAIVSGNALDYQPTFPAPFFSTGAGSKSNHFLGAADANANVVGASVNGRVDIDAGYANSDVSPFSISQIWYNAAVAFQGIRLAIDEGLSAAGSKVLQIFGGAGAAVAYLTIKKGGNTGIGVASPTAVLHLKACAAAADSASLKIPAGTLATTPASGNIESDGTHLYWTDSGGTRRQLDA